MHSDRRTMNSETLKTIFFKFIDLREREKERVGGGGSREKVRETDLLFHLLMHSLVDSCMCPDQESNTQPWHIGTML